MDVKCVMQDGSVRILPVSVEKLGTKTTAIIPKEHLAKGIDFVDLLPDYLTASSDDDGYMVVPAGSRQGTFLCRFKRRDDAEFVTQLMTMPVFGMKKNCEGVVAIISGMELDCKLVVGVCGGRYYLYPRFCLEGDAAYEDIKVEYISLPDADYNEIAKYYREHQLMNGRCIPLKERIQNNKILQEVAQSIEVRIRLGWKPVPSPVRHQTLETEPPMKVACSFERVSQLIDAFYQQGIHQAEFCLVGWNISGHDGRFPQLFPVDERLGGEEKLKALIHKTQSLGYRIVCHVSSADAYEIADCWDEEYVTKSKDGSLVELNPAGPMALSGGQAYSLCPQCSFERFVTNDYYRIRELGFEGAHYIDELTARPALKCYDAKHPLNRRQCISWYHQMTSHAKEIFGAVSSEGPYDHLLDDIDFVLYTTHNSFIGPDIIPMCDESIPFWQLVYHGIVMSNAGSDTINHVIKDKAKHLKFIEYGGRPLFYYYSKFINEEDKGATFKNWMGSKDLTCDTDEELAISVSAVQSAYKEYEQLKYLQYEFMDKHEKISDHIYQVTYSDGTVITVDYKEEKYEVKKLK